MPRVGKTMHRKAILERMRESGNTASQGTTCTCGHALEEHGGDPQYPGSTSCTECDCIAYESNE